VGLPQRNRGVRSVFQSENEQEIGIGSRRGYLSYFPPTPPDMRVRIRRFGMLRFPKQADLSAVALSSPVVPFPRFAVLLGFTLPLQRELRRRARTSVEHDRDSVHTLSFPFGPSRVERRTEVLSLL